MNKISFHNNIPPFELAKLQFYQNLQNMISLQKQLENIDLYDKDKRDFIICTLNDYNNRLPYLAD